jgi:hypothetical protein
MAWTYLEKNRVVNAYGLSYLFSEEPSGEHMTELENTKSLVHRLFTILHLEEIQKRRERHLMAKIDHLQEQLRPLEQVGRLPSLSVCN